jgi:hypothetical protein
MKIFMKLILVNLVIFSGFAEECSWNGVKETTREEIKSFLILSDNEKENSIIKLKVIVKTTEEPMAVEVITTPEEGGERANVRYHYKFKTQAAEFSTDPEKENRIQRNDFSRMEFSLWIERDEQEHPVRQVCMVYFKNINIPIFNLSLDDFFIGRIILFDFTDRFEFNIPLPSSIN